MAARKRKADEPEPAADAEATPTPPVTIAREGAFFDLDKTLLPGSSLFPLVRELYRRKIITARDVARMTFDHLMFMASGNEGDARTQRARDSTLEVVKGMPQAEVVEFGRSVAHQELIPRLYPQAVDLIHRQERAGRQVYICSAAPQDYLRILGEVLGVAGVIGTRAEVVRGRYTGRLLGELNHGPEKARRVAELAAEQGIDLARSYAYSDSVNDLPMLELVGFPVAMNPDPKLRAIARQRGWIRLDYRIARRRTIAVSGFGGVAAAAGAVGYAAGFAVGRSRTLRYAAAIRG